MKDRTPIFTYIVRTEHDGLGEFYCGKTNNIKRRMKEHMKEKYPQWFAQRKSRKIVREIVVYQGDIEKSIKRFGVKKFYSYHSPINFTVYNKFHKKWVEIKKVLNSEGGVLS